MQFETRKLVGDLIGVELYVFPHLKFDVQIPFFSPHIIITCNDLALVRKVIRKIINEYDCGGVIQLVHGTPEITLC